MNKKIALLAALILPFLLFVQQQKEVLIVDTMHAVTRIVKNSYKPLLKRALGYQPEAIYVEYVMPDDVASWSYLKDGWNKGYREFYKLSDSLKVTYSFQPSELAGLLAKKQQSSLKTSWTKSLHLLATKEIMQITCTIGILSNTG
ncbi:MAG: hypothetical protein LBG19_08170 [Prevotellaceae bacterium]|jgi:hypothetical protein|nr:hypothetical protein [Prevotellaceae bacterium]